MEVIVYRDRSWGIDGCFLESYNYRVWVKLSFLGFVECRVFLKI